jgi:hypothetical protein
MDRCFYLGRDCARVDVASGACEVCVSGLQLMGFSCLSVSAKVTNCYVFNQKECLACKLGFGLLRGVCVVIPQCAQGQFVNEVLECQDRPFGCQRVDPSDFTCAQCYPNFLLRNDTRPLDLSCSPVLPANCFNLTPVGECQSCAARYFASDFGCKLVSRYCKAYNFAGRC